MRRGSQHVKEKHPRRKSQALALSVKALRQECRGMHLGNSPVCLYRVSKGKAEGGKEGQCRAADHEKVSASEDHKCQWRVRSRAGT